MTPKEKAKDIFDSYWYCLMQSDIRNRSNWAKECALIAIEEIIKSKPYWDTQEEFEYWYEVEHEIEKL